MRHIKSEDKNIRISADDAVPEWGNASHRYELNYSSGGYSKIQVIVFQYGPISEAGVNGISNEALLTIVIDRLEGFQSGKYANNFNQEALGHCYSALDALKARTAEREARGVEGTHTV